MAQDERITAEDMTMLGELLKSIVNMTMLVPKEWIEGGLREYRFQETVQPILDPTAYMQGMHDRSTSKGVLTAFSDFRNALENIREQVAARGASMVMFEGEDGG